MPDGCTRRCVLKGLGALAVGTLSLPMAGCGDAGAPAGGGTATNCGGNLCLDLGDPSNQALRNPGGAVFVDSPTDTIIVIRASASTVTALSAFCTHQGCVVGFDANQSLLVCPCHGSVFSESGSVVQGPARRALHVYQATLTGNQIVVTLA